MVTTHQDISTKSKAAAYTLAIHVLLLLLFFFLKYSLPVLTPVEELGMEVNLGTDPDGSGDDQPMAVSDPAADRSDARYRSAAQQNEGMKDMMRSDDPDDPEVNATRTDNNSRINPNLENSRRNRNDRPQENNDRRRQERPRYVYPGSTGQGGNRAMSDAPGTNEGNTSGSGDRGVPGGTPGAANYEGSPGFGNGGVSHNLTGRQISPARFEAEFRYGGKVEVSVTVDKAGNIISKRIKKSPSAELSRIALQKLSQARFSPSSVPEQTGIVTIIFKARL